MIAINDADFRHIVADAIDAIPEKYGNNIANLAFVVEDTPSPVQREKLRLRHDQTLFGLYEGVPLPHRGAGYNLVLPDKITIFRLPILIACTSAAEVRAQVKNTVWHEVAHYFGLDHREIERLEDKNK